MTDKHLTKSPRAVQPLGILRETLEEARTSDDAERIHAALIEVVAGLIAHAEQQGRAIEGLRSDLTYKQGIVSKIGGGDYIGPQDNLPETE